MVADVLRENGVSVLLNSVHRLPRFKEDDIDLPYKLPKLLADEVVLFGLQVDAQMTEMNTLNLPFYAGTARKYGLTEEQAVMSLTRNVAQILGVDDVCGSIEKLFRRCFRCNDKQSYTCIYSGQEYRFGQ